MAYRYLEPTDIFDFFDKLKAFMTETISPAWEVLRWNDTRDSNGDIEFWASTAGFTGQDKCILGFKTYINAASDLYNLRIMSCTAFNSSLSYNNQVNFTEVAACSLNLQHPVWLCGDARHVRWVTRLAASYFCYYAGMYIPYQPQMVQPFYVMIAGNASAVTARYSTVTDCWWANANTTTMKALSATGWTTPSLSYHSAADVQSSLSMHNKRLLSQLILSLGYFGVMGCPVGFYKTTAFSALPEDIIQVAGEIVTNFLLVPNCAKRGTTDYIAFGMM